MGMENPKTVAGYVSAGANIMGVEALYRIGEITVRVKVKEKRTAYGRTDVRIEPVGGLGTKWVNINSLGDVIPVVVSL